MTHGDPKNPKQNPHPVKRYEVTATADAPGPWDSVKSYIGYDVINPECTPEDKFMGVHAMPQDVGHDIEMTKVDEKTWKGYFYRDMIQDEDYYGLGLCHWDATSVTANFVAHEIRFNSGSMLEEFLRKGPQTEYFKRSSYGDRAFVRYGAQDYAAADNDVIQHPHTFFQITVTVTVKEVTR